MRGRRRPPGGAHHLPLGVSRSAIYEKHHIDWRNDGIGRYLCFVLLVFLAAETQAIFKVATLGV